MLAAGLSLSSCGKGKKVTKTILSKSPTNFFDFPLPNGYCRFRYKEYENEDPIEFDDSCNKYNIGDTLK